MSIYTKEELLAQNAVLQAKIDKTEKEDLERRTVLSGLLDSYEWISDGYGSYNNKTTKKTMVRDWLGISFLIGELKADANYSCLIDGREMMRNEIADLKQQLATQREKNDHTNVKGD